MTMRRIISGSRLTPLLMGRVWLSVIGFLAGLSLFSQIQDKFRTGSDIVTPALSRLYFQNIFLLFLFYTLI